MFLPFHHPFRSCTHLLRHLLTALAATTLLGACDDPDDAISGASMAPQTLRPYVAGAAAVSLNSKGLFDLPKPEAPGSRPIITSEEAGRLALASVKSWGPSLQASWSKERGEAIDISNLTLGPRTVFARTPYGELPSGQHPAIVRVHGPYYLVTLYSASTPVLLISVAAYNEGTKVNNRGLIDRAQHRGMEFVSHALPIDTTQVRMISPEEAVESVGRATGARVVTTPELVRPPLPYSPASSMWKLTLDRDVSVKGAGGVRRTRQIFVGPERDRRMMAAVPGNGRTLRSFGVDVSGQSQRPVPIDLPIVDGESASYERVDLVRGGE
ncbi:MAG TPA: hypothetical protein VF647_22190 [Longimicrobium sp.]|jgi:hypothetical protein